MLNTPPHLEARVPRGFVSIFHGTSSSVARRRLRASDLSFRQSMPSFDIGRPGLQMQSGASAVLGGVGELPGVRFIEFQSTRPVWGATCHRDIHEGWGQISIHAPVWGATDDMATRYNTVAISIHAPRGGRGGVSAGRPAGRSLCRTGSSCAYRVRSDCRSGTSRRERTGCRCFWKCPNRRT